MATHDSPTGWFCELEQAIRAGNHDREIRARRELAVLGVLVVIDARSVLVSPMTREDRAPRRLRAVPGGATP